VPCFVETSIASEPLLGGQSPFNCWNNCPAGTEATIFRSYCYLDALHTPADVVRLRVEQCLTPNRPNPSSRVAFLIGDSHAASIKIAVQRAVQHEMALVWTGLTGNTCGYVHLATSGVCLDAISIMQTQLTTHLRSGDMVIVSNAGYKYWNAPAQASQRALLRNLYTTILQPRGAHLVIMGDPPRLPTYAVRCLYQPANCHSSTTNNDQNAQLASLTSESPGMLYVEIHHLFCNSANCEGQVPGTTTWAFFDNSHLTTSGGLYLWPYLCAAFEAAGFL